MFLAAVLFFTGINVSASSASAEGSEVLNTPEIDMSKLILKGVPSEKVEGLKKKIKEGKKLDSDKYMEKMAKEAGKDGSELTLATMEDPYFRKDFPDGSFIENSIVDETAVAEEGTFSALGVTQVGGTSEYRTLRVNHTAAWGYMSYRVKIHFPMGGNGRILQAYDWYYIGAIAGVDYSGIYRANETATADAVAIYRLQVGHSGFHFIAKLDFRIRDGRYWSAYSS